MDLPRELRDEVYEGLLCGSIYGTKTWRHGLEPAILRTCKQVCEEASKVLYTKYGNGTFMIRIDAEAYEKFPIKSSFKGRPLFQVSFPIAKGENDKVGGLPILEMEISVLPMYQAKNKAVLEHHFAFIGFLPSLPKICRYLTCSYAAELQLVVHMESPLEGPSYHRQQVLSDCLEYFCEARGLGRAVILTEPRHSAAAAKIVDIMKTPIKTADEVFRVICSYEARVLRQTKEKRWHDVRDTLENAISCFSWIYWLRRTSSLNRLTRKEKHELDVKRIDTQWKYISCCLKLGRTDDLRDEVRQMFKCCPPGNRSPVQQSYWNRAADAHCAMGNAYIIDRALNSAAYSLLQALLTAPGHFEADRTIKNLEERVKSSLKPEEMMVRLNIECVLKKVQHRKHDCGDLTEDAKKEFVGDFRATHREIQSILRNPLERKVNSQWFLVYSNV